MLLLAISAGVASQLSSHAHRVDEAVLIGQAAALAENIEERLVLVGLINQGTDVLLNGTFDLQEFVGLSNLFDLSSLDLLSGVISYPVTADGIGAGAFVYALPGAPETPPVIDLDSATIEQVLVEHSQVVSEPLATGSGTHFAFLSPVVDGPNTDLVGVLISVDDLLQDPHGLVGSNQLAVALVDTRDTSRGPVASVGQPTLDIERRIPLSQAGGIWELIVRPGSEFASSRNPWIPGAVVFLGLVISILLVRMGSYAQARAEDMAEKLQMAENLNRGRDLFLAAVSHELRTPLTVAHGFALELAESVGRRDPGEVSELLELISSQTEQASNIVEDLLVAARAYAGRLTFLSEEVALAPLVDYALSTIERAEHSRITVESTDSLVYADATRVRQILRNLVDNAVRYGGRSIWIRVETTDDRVTVKVEDDGTGIPSHLVERIYEPYERATPSSIASPTGVGVGLYVSRSLARLMGGNLEYTYRNGRSTFSFTLPAASLHNVPDADGSYVAPAPLPTGAAV